MDNFPEPDISSASSSIAAVRQAWLGSVRAGNAERLAAMVTDDIVVVHGNGRCVRGRDELKAGNALDLQVWKTNFSSVAEAYTFIPNAAVRQSIIFWRFFRAAGRKRTAKLATEVKLLSAHHRFVIALHSPSGVA